MDLIVSGRRFITNDPKLINELVEEGAANASQVEGLTPRKEIIGNWARKFGDESNKRPDEISFGYGIGELSRRPGRERR